MLTVTRYGRSIVTKAKPTKHALQKFLSSHSQTETQSEIDGGSLPTNVHVQLDFFGEPITFKGSVSDDNSKLKTNTTKAMAALDGFQLVIVSKGLSCIGGGDEEGLELKPAHSVALAWTQAARFATVWNQPQDDGKDIQSSPMLAVVVVVPLMLQTGIPYVKHLDTLLAQTKPPAPGFPILQLYEMATVSAACWENHQFSLRERMHLQALNYLLQQNFNDALIIYLKLLRRCPGDALALSFAIDLAHTLSDKHSAFKAATTVASYWHERRGGLITPAIPGHAMVSSMVAVGLAAAGRTVEAEQMAENAMKQGRKFTGALATWAQCLVFDATGRVAEGISAMANGDGIANYEGSGLLFFESHLGGYGARFCIDREERGRGKSQALRLYEVNFERILNYSGYAEGRAWKVPEQKAPLGWIPPPSLAGKDEDTPNSSFFSGLFLLSEKNEKQKRREEEYELILKGEDKPSKRVEGWEPLCEDVLTWLPPTPKLLSDATLLLLRLTLNGTISTRDNRWDTIKNAWTVMLDIESRYSEDTPLSVLPITQLAASLVVDPGSEDGIENDFCKSRLSRGLSRMGTLLKLGKGSENQDDSDQDGFSIRELIADKEPDFWLPAKDNMDPQWKEVVDCLTDGLDGFDSSRRDSHFARGDDENHKFISWDFDTRPILEHSIVYACCKAGDIESLFTARAICSQGVTLRPSSPEEWWRYSIVLGLLGDVVASEDALNTSINVGGGQGSRG